MKLFYQFKLSDNKKKKFERTSLIKKPILMLGDNKTKLKELEEKSVSLVFTSPPYYNTKDYSSYKSYFDYLVQIEEVFKECNRVLEDGRHIIVNISPVIVKRPGREFESTRYPIHFDFHNLLTKNGFHFIDEIIWVKNPASVTSRGNESKNKTPLGYKPKAVSESILVYRKNANFLIDRNISVYSDKDIYPPNAKIEETNIWNIHPKSSRLHPAIFPEELCERILSYYSYKGDVVLDPWAGIGTFGISAIKLKRIPVLCEIDKEYFNIMETRITNQMKNKSS
jgi:DNA modification methylase